MKKLLFIGVLLLFSVQFIFCRPVDVKEALEIAQRFCQQNNRMIKSATSNSLTLAYVCTDGQSSQLRSTEQDAYYYVFNKPENQGFIIVSGESGTPSAILGYSDNGEYTEDNQPVNFKAWMNAYKEAIKSIMVTPESTVQKIDRPVLKADYAEAVAPLLGRISWDQGEPYNLLCPMDKNQNQLSYTGCVATAMAQIMRYYNWPERGTGKNDYTTRTLKMKLSADFSQSVYDWKNMTETYSANSTEAEKQAVALLMKDFGFAAFMDYSANSSGTYSIDAANALIEHFNYDSDLQFCEREYYTAIQWDTLLKEELNARRPVFYSGYDGGSGHAFVCDGYDTNNLYHINWGWGGVSDGYFDVRTLSPNTQGIGGSTGGFSFLQEILANIQKPDGDSGSNDRLRVTKPLVSSADETDKDIEFVVQMELSNRGSYSADPEVGLALYQGETLKELLFQSSFNSPLPMGAQTGLINLPVTIPGRVNDGTYFIYPVYRSKGKEKWERVYGKIGAFDYLSVVVDGNKVTIGRNAPVLNLEPASGEGIEVIGKLYQGKTGNIKLNIKNTGSMEYTGGLYVFILDVNDQDNRLFAYKGTSIQPGESTNIEMSGKIISSPGSYNIVVLYDQYRASDGIYPITEAVLPVTIYPTPDPAKLSLTEKISLEKNTLLQHEELAVSATVKNSGGVYNDLISAFIFASGGESAVDYMMQNVLLEENQSTTLLFNKQIDLDPGKYTLYLFYFDEKGEYARPTPSRYNSVNFTVGAADITNESVSPFTIYPNPVKDVLFIRSEEKIKSLRILSVSGEQLLAFYPESSETVEVPVSGLSKGIYLLRVESESGITTRKFMKE